MKIKTIEEIKMNKNLYKGTSKSFKPLEEFFEKIKYKQITVPKVVTSAVNALDIDNQEMPLIFALSELTSFVSQFAFKIRLDRKTLVTTNLYTMLYSSSGSKKDASMNLIRGCITNQYDMILAEVNNKLINKAKADCQRVNGNTKKWRDFYKGKVNTFFPSVSTPEGMLHQMSHFDKIDYGAFNIVVNELGTELKSSGDAMLTNMKVLASGYDLGKIPSKLVKTADLQTPDIKNLNINILMFSSIHTLLKEKNVRDKFIDTFITQYARRTLFYFNTEEDKPKEINNIDSLVKHLRESDKSFSENTERLERQIKTIYTKLVGLREKTNEIIISDEVDETIGYSCKDIYNLYRELTDNKSTLIHQDYEMYSLAVKHSYWRVLKLAGLFSLMRGKIVIEVNELLMAISVIEHFNQYIYKFQEFVNKEPYELIAEYAYVQANGNRAKLSKHKLIKAGFIPSNFSDKRFEEMLPLLNSVDVNAIFSYRKGYLIVKPISDSLNEPTNVKQELKVVEAEKEVEKPSEAKIETKETKAIDTLVITGSYLPFKGKDGKWLEWDDPKESKVFRAKNSHKGWVAIKDTNLKDKSFRVYEKLVALNCCYSPYSFKDGHRMLDNIDSLTDTIVIDVDKGSLTMDQVHELLSGYKHVIASTSDINNKFKYRIIMPLDRQVDLTSTQWKQFYKSISNMFNIPADPAINKASMFFGFKGAKVLSNYKGKLLPTKIHLINAYKEEMNNKKEIKPAKTDKELEIIWDNRYDIFIDAYEAFEMRRLKMYVAMRTAIDLGLSKELIKELISEINSNLHRPVRFKQVRAEILSQLDRLYDKHSPNVRS